MLFRELKNYHARIYRFFLHLTNHQDLAEDLTQETFYRALMSIHNFKGKSTVLTWLYSIARNVYSQQRRKDKIFEYHNDCSNIKADSCCEPQEVLLKKEAWKEIAGVLNELPEDYKTIIILREVENMSFDEIGEILNKTPSTARVTLFRAKKAFRKIFKKRSEKNV